MVQAKGIRPLDSRLSAERDASSKYSTPARSRAFGLWAARRAIPIRGVGAGLSAQIVGMGHLVFRACVVSLFIRLLSRPKIEPRWGRVVLSASKEPPQLIQQAQGSFGMSDERPGFDRYPPRAFSAGRRSGFR